ncbi:MAG: FecR domain-containing protein [Elainellaceae cyanobacterium]
MSVIGVHLAYQYQGNIAFDTMVTLQSKVKTRSVNKKIAAILGARPRCGWLIGTALIGLTAGLTAAGRLSPAGAQQLTLPQAERWLEVQEMQGSVTFREAQTQRPARLGDRLQSRNSGLTTAALSASTLALDSNIGVVQVAENTSLRVSGLRALRDGARVTSLRVDRGQARLQIRRFTNPNSNLEIETPAGTAAVRGTDFGVAVTPVGKTSIGTESGAVEAQAQGVSVMVNPGFASVIVPGEPPSLPIPIDRALQLRVGPLEQDGGRVILSGHIDPSNTLLINGEIVETRLNGRFRVSLPTLPRRRRARVAVQNPLGDRRNYSLVLRSERR